MDATADQKSHRIPSQSGTVTRLRKVTINRSPRGNRPRLQDGKPATRPTGIESGASITNLKQLKRRAQKALTRIPVTAQRVLDRIEALEGLTCPHCGQRIN